MIYTAQMLAPFYQDKQHHQPAVINAAISLT